MNPFEGLKRCPFCHRLPVLTVRGRFWVGGCEEHLPNAVMQPDDMPAEATRQWNTVVELMEASGNDA